MYSTAGYTLVDCSQLQLSSPISKSSLQLIHPRKIVSISLVFEKTHRYPNGFRRIRIIPGRQVSSHSPAASSNNNYAFDCDSTHNDFVLPPGKLQFRNVTWIGIATITSKVLGLVREIVIASVFGIGPVATAFRYASVLPGFAASVLGGVNGPIHITMAATLSKLPQDRQEKLFKHANTVMILVGGLVAALVFIFSKSLIHVYAPGLWTSTEGQITSQIAIQQLKIMSSCIVFAGPVGLGFGYLSAKGENVFPAISPAFSSLLLIASCLFYSFSRKSDALSSGGVLLSCGASLGVVVQWIIQVALLRGAWHELMSASWIDGFRSRDLCEAFHVILLPILSVMSSLANPIIRILFERYAFDSSASALVSSLYLFYSLGSPFLIVRELLVAVFYAFGDGLRPFLVSIGAIALNALLDWFFVYRLNSGVQGLALATSFTAALSLVTLFYLLQRKVGGLFHLPELIGPGLLLCFCCVISSSVTSISYEMISKNFLSEYITRLPRIQELYCIVSAAALGIIGFFAPLLLYYFSRYKLEQNSLNIDET
uniref:Uncharacterized protein LOC104245231 isoform X4 n=1 Tax=Nicotiana sylvestris TaxID=4096 RepID=A0A1U7Y7M9_NICSY|nr:PREDICTED: uncharacterized protein LOC104245231 isoform X4 [Nicotiana sylvestris]